MSDSLNTAAKRAREVLAYCKLWTDGDAATVLSQPERKILEHRVVVIDKVIKMLDNSILS